MTFDSVTLTFDLWPWTFAVYRLWRDETLCQIWTQSSNPRRSYRDFNIWPYDLERRVTWQKTCCARLWDNFHQVWPSTTYACLNCSVFWCWYVISRCDIDLWPVDLESSWYITRHMINVCTKFERNRAINELLINICAHVVSRRNLFLWPLDLELLQHFGCLVFKLRTKFERNRIISGWVIDDLARFRV